MRSRFPGFATVRVTCCFCGWFRVLGHTGSNGIVCAYIRLVSDPAECNVVSARVIERPVSLEPETWDAKKCGYSNLAEEWHWRRPHAELAPALRARLPLIQGRACPRCNQRGGVRLDLFFDPEAELTHGIMVMCEPEIKPES